MADSRPAPAGRRAGRALVTAVLTLTVTLGGLLAACDRATPNAAPAPSAPVRSVTSSRAPAPVGTTDPSPTPVALSPPFIDRAVWVKATGGRSLRVYPTANGRRTQGAGDADEAWGEVLRLAPDADQPGMRAQFECHWTYARRVAPDKPSWNLEPWRPVVSVQQMVDAQCNPGGPESAES